MPTNPICQFLLKSELSDSYSSSDSSDSSNNSNDSSDNSSTSTSLSSSSSSSVSITHTATSISSHSSSNSDSNKTALMKHCQASIQAMRCTWCFLHMILTTQVLFPHEVPKCSLLSFVIECLKFDDPVHFQYDLHVDPHTFDILVPLIEDHPVFQTNSQTPQLPVAYQLSITLYQFGHFGSSAAMKA